MKVFYKIGEDRKISRKICEKFREKVSALSDLRFIGRDIYNQDEIPWYFHIMCPKLSDCEVLNENVRCVFFLRNSDSFSDFFFHFNTKSKVIKQLPPFLVSVSEPEILRDDGIKAVEIAHKIGIEAELDQIIPHGMHAQAIMGLMCPEGKEALARFAAWVHKKVFVSAFGKA